ncbi:MAG: hypothetical protein WAO20_13060 [Acidobacteriota bacterium]
MVEVRVIARTIRMLARHIRFDTQLVVLVCRETGEVSIVPVGGNRNFRQELEEHLCHGLCALGLIAFDRQGQEQRHFCFPWVQDDPDGQALFEKICRGLGPPNGPQDPHIRFTRAF